MSGQAFSPVLFILLTSKFLISTDAASCGGKTFNRNTQTCCLNMIRELPKQAVQLPSSLLRCCGSIPYVTTTQLCCNRNPPAILPRRNPRHLCCGKTKSYNSVTQTCCGGTVLNKPNPLLSYSCCGKKLFRHKIYQCCRNVIRAKPVANGNYGCCGTRLVQYPEQMCCNGALHARPAYRPNDWRCCGKSIMNSKSHICCANRMQVRPGCFASCCRARPYSRESSMCCDGVLRPLPKFNSNMFSCCRTATYDRREKLCCGGRLVDKTSVDTRCCGTVAFDLNSQICCGGKIFRKPNDFARCCNRSRYDIRQNICCYPNVKARPNGVSSACCRSIVYNQNTQVCCKGVVKPLSFYQSGRC